MGSMSSSADPHTDGGYRAAAPVYDAIIDPLLTDLRQVGLALVHPRAGEHVLDIGCGTGTFLAAFARLGCRVTGVDLSAAMAARAHQRLGPDADVHVTDATAMPFEAQCFDVVSTSMALHEMDPEVRIGVLREAARVCRARGRLLLIDYHPGDPRGLKGRFTRAFTFAVERFAGGDHYRNYRQFMRAGGLPALLDQVGLKIAQEKYVGRGNFAVLVAVAR